MNTWWRRSVITFEFGLSGSASPRNFAWVFAWETVSVFMPNTEKLHVTFYYDLTGSTARWWHWKWSSWRQRRECPLRPFEKVRHWGASLLKSICFNLEKLHDVSLSPFLLIQCASCPSPKILSFLILSWRMSSRWAGHACKGQRRNL